jgi:6-phosphogluconate dehydrogenase (decarboxylating)
MNGLGRMGGRMGRRHLCGGHASVVFDSRTASVPSLAQQGAAGSSSLDKFNDIGGGNAKWLYTLPKSVRVGSNANAFVGGTRPWTHHA